MIILKDNFVNIVQTQLDKDEIILKNFYSPNIEMVQEGIDKYVTESF